MRLALPERKLDCRTRSAKRFFHGNAEPKHQGTWNSRQIVP